MSSNRKVQLDAFLAGGQNLTILGDAPSRARTNIRRLSELGVLNDFMLWQLMSQTEVDPLFLIRLFRSCKDKIGLHQTEQVFEDCVVFTCGPLTTVNYSGQKPLQLAEVSIHVNIFTNDIQIMCLKDDRYVARLFKTSNEIFEALKDKPAGQERLDALVEYTKKLVEDARTDSKQAGTKV